MPALATKSLILSTLGCLVASAACHRSADSTSATGTGGGTPAHLVPLSGFASGSRLRARVLDGGGDAVRFEGFFDKKLGVPCAFAMAEDGVPRCLPTVDDHAGVYFSDSHCKEPLIVAAVSSCSPSPAPYVRWDRGAAGESCL